CLFPQPVLRNVQNMTAWPDRRAFGCRGGGFRRNVFKFEGDGGNPACKLADRVQVVVRGGHFQIGNLSSGCVLVGRICVDTVTHAARRDGKHASKLHASQYANGAPGKNGRSESAGAHAGKLSLRTDSRCFRRKLSSRKRRSGCLFASMLTARSAAFFAPALPIASVPTGTPAGICTMESRESMPFKVLLLIGTPSTGSVVWAATIPGRWAAPPAAAIITSRPRSIAPFAYSAIQSG